jgi:hypothetical protein
LAHGPYGGTNALWQSLDQRLQAPIIAAISMRRSFKLCRRLF